MSESPKVYKYLINSPRWKPEPEIRKVECVKETKAYAELNLKQCRQPYKMEKHGRVYDRWVDAYEALMARARLNLNSARLELQRAQGLYGNIVGMKPPADETTTTTTDPC